MHTAVNIYAEDSSAVQDTGNEALRMADQVSEGFYSDSKLKEELEAEIVSVTEDFIAWEEMTEDDLQMDDYPTVKRKYYTLTHHGESMDFFMDIVGNPGENGKYPLYLTLHGGGESTKLENDDQWVAMFEYYHDSVENGIYIACRGITDTWDMHFQEESYPLYDRLIEAMVVLCDADPDRVYLLGFSAGGDGVYQVAPRLADRFAAVNMSSGHPNGVSVVNLANCPICLQVGIRDYYIENVQRSISAARYGKLLSEYNSHYGFGYEHQTWVHVPDGHNYVDYQDTLSRVLSEPDRFAETDADLMLAVFQNIAIIYGLDPGVSNLSYLPSGVYDDFDQEIVSVVEEEFHLNMEEANTNAVRYVSQFVRNPVPEKLVWDLSTRAEQREKDSFYWLKADSSVNQGIITASIDPETNTITVEPDEKVNGDFSILFHPQLIDAAKPVTIITPEGEYTLDISVSEEYLKASALENGDPELACFGEIQYSALQ